MKKNFLKIGYYILSTIFFIAIHSNFAEQQSAEKRLSNIEQRIVTHCLKKTLLELEAATTTEEIINLVYDLNQCVEALKSTYNHKSLMINTLSSK